MTVSDIGAAIYCVAHFREQLRSYASRARAHLRYESPVQTFFGTAARDVVADPRAARPRRSCGMSVKIYLTRDELYVIADAVVFVEGKLKVAGLSWLGTPYQTVNAKMDRAREATQGCPPPPEGFSNFERKPTPPADGCFVKFTEDELGALMCAADAVAFGASEQDLGSLVQRLAREQPRAPGPLGSVCQKLSIIADQRAAGFFGKIAMAKAAARGRFSGYWGLEKAMPDLPFFRTDFGSRFRKAPARLERLQKRAARTAV